MASSATRSAWKRSRPLFSLLAMLALVSPAYGAGHFTSTASASPQSASAPRFHARAVTSASVHIDVGWNLIDLPLQAGISSASALATSLDAPGQLGSNAVAAIATYTQGAYNLYVPGFSADLQLASWQGVLVQSRVSGTWSLSGTAYAGGQTVPLSVGWNLAAAPYPPGGLDTAAIAGQVGSGAVQAITTYAAGTAQTWTPGMPAVQIPPTSGMWILSSSARTWTPISAIPPDPGTVAPAINQTVPTDLATATQFVYSGSDPIQTGVAPNTISKQRAAILRGKVATSDGQPLPGVTVSVLDHPEFGQTLTRADGRFDLAVNGGGQLTVSYARDGYLPIQRRMEVPWQDYVALPDVVMIQPDPNVSAIDLSSSAPIQVASGSPITDSRGTRQARLFFQQGTMATMTLPNGATQQLSTMHVRATEYTVGASGQASMPGDLPAGEAYMYAADFTVDEATAAKATSVQFSKPVISYTENFLNLAVGSKVPSLYRDPANGTWVNGPSVLVIKILSVSNGLADLDVDGSGQPASAATLAGLGITDPERQQLAATYAPGQTLWRGALTHFTDWDY